MKPLHRLVTGATIIVAVSTSPAFSQSTTDESMGERSLSAGIGFAHSTQAFQGHIGLGIGAFPEYEGADGFGAIGLPLLEIEKPGAYFVRGGSINTNDGLASAGVTIFHFSYSGTSGRGARFTMGPLVRAYGGRDEDDNNSLEGLGDIDRSIGIGGFMDFDAGPWSVNLAMAPQDTGDDQEGLLVTLDAGYTASVNKALTIFTGLATSWGDDDYMQGYFGVNDSQAARSGLTRFNGEAGMKDVGVYVKTSYALSQRWLLDAQAGYWRLLNDAADSPIVDSKGSANQVRGLLGLSYRY